MRDNITFGTDFDSIRYYKAISITRLSNEICFTGNKDDYPMETFQFSKEQLERICFARAIFCDRFVAKLFESRKKICYLPLCFDFNREIIVLDEPLSSIADEKEISDIFRQAVDNLIKAGKTVIVASQNPGVSW